MSCATPDNTVAGLTVAKTAGFCFGVSRAVAMTREAAARGAYALGQVIHNSAVVEELERAGLHTVSAAEAIPDGAVAVIRAHGERQSVIDGLAARGVEIVNTTCPCVAHIHQIVMKESRAGRRVIVIGLHDHPEAVATSSRAEDVVILSDPEETAQHVLSPGFDPDLPCSVVAQTTADKEIWKKCVEILKKHYTNLKIFDTICNATSLRQREAASLAETADVMLVIGDSKSANTVRLRDICAARCANTFLLSGAEELDCILPALRTIHPRKIGLTAGASTPEVKIEEVIHMSEEKQIIEAEEIAAETNPETEESFAEMVDRSIKTLHTGQRVTGVVTRIAPNEIHVDLGTKHAGFIPVSELSDDPAAKPEDIVKVGEEIEVFVTKVNDAEGIVTLSKKRIDAARGWESIDAARADKALLEGTVVEINKGGIVVSVNGVRVFVPASHTGKPKEADLNEMLKTKVTLRITEVNRAKRRIIGSIRYANEDLRKAASEKIWETIEVGNVYEGVVKSLTSFGAFIDIGGADGMAHITELGWGRIKHPSDAVAIGDKVTARVIALDTEKHKISLTLKSESDNPWVKFTGSFQVGDVADVKIVKLMQFGAFAEIIPGVDGLIHISQLADHRIARPADVVSEGDMVKAKILDINNENEKVSLSIRAALEEGFNAYNKDEEAPADAE